jgi:CIC family chloride channel protein
MRPRSLALIEAGTIGLVAGLAAVLLKGSTEALGSWRTGPMLVWLGWPAWVALPLTGAIGCGLAGWLVVALGPETAGSGIPQVKAVLAYVPMRLNLRVAIVKLLGTILTLGSGLTLGRQGPTVQVGAALAAQLSYWIPTSSDYRRQMIAAGAAAGLAAGFNAPIAGVLFVMEELLRDVSGFTLGPAILASFVGAVVSRTLGGQALPAILNESGAVTDFEPQDIPIYLLLGVLAGLVGALFNRGILASQRWSNRLSWGLPWKMGLTGLISGLAVAGLPATFWVHSSLRESVVSGSEGWQLTAIAFVAQLALTWLAFASGAPGGLFAPSLVMGASLGYEVGYLSSALGETGREATLALAGMGAVFSAVSRVPITAIVIIMEMTADFELVLPLMIVAVTAYVVAERVDPGSLYERLLAAKGIVSAPSTPTADVLASLKAKDFMHTPVETLAQELTVAAAVQIFARSPHRGFPVLAEGRLVGMLTQTDLAKRHALGIPDDAPLATLTTFHPMTVQIEDPLADVRLIFSRYNLSRLPVLEGRRLVGIITRSDLLRAESQRLSGEPIAVTSSQGHRAPSYAVYKRRGPNVGKGRILIPLGNPHTAGHLLQLGLAIARARDYEVECMQAIVVPHGRSPAETRVNVDQSQRWLDAAVAIGRTHNVPIHAQIRVTHDTAHAILDTIRERRIDLLITGWKGNTSTPERIFGDTVDTLIHRAPCEMMLVKWGPQVWQPAAIAPKLPLAALTNSSALQRIQRWLVPVGGGPNVRRAIALLPALIRLSEQPQISLCQVFRPNDYTVDTQHLDRAAAWLRNHVTAPVTAAPICATSVRQAIIHLAEQDQCDAIILGASREGLLQQTVRGNLPEAIARQSRCTTILVRSALADLAHLDDLTPPESDPESDPESASGGTAPESAPESASESASGGTAPGSVATPGPTADTPPSAPESAT